MKAASLLAWIPAVCLVSIPPAGTTPALEPYVAPGRLYALYKPADWKVIEESHPDSFAITVAPSDGSAEVHLYWARVSAPPGRRRTALDFLREIREAELKSKPGASFSELLGSRDSARAAVTERYQAGGIPCRNRLFVETDGRKWSLQTYSARDAEFAARRPLLLNIMMSVAFIKPPKGADPQPAAVHQPLVERRAPDGSLTLRVPQSWAFLAAKGKVVTSADGGGAGFIFDSFQGNPIVPSASVLQGMIGRRYMPPAQSLPFVLSGFGNQDPKVLQETRDPATAAQYRSVVGRRCEASDLLASWTSKGGQDCVGAFKVVNALPAPMGMWNSIVAGVWGPRAQVGAYLPLLTEVARSYAINDQYAHSYIQAGLANLKRLQQQTAAEMRSLSYAREDMQKAWKEREARKDYMDSKWDDYRRGDIYWVSDLEGGKVYHTDTWGTKDTRTGDYYEGGDFTWTNFEGRNPRYPAEDMREVSSWELEHGAPPK